MTAVFQPEREGAMPDPWFAQYFADDYYRFDRHTDTDMEVEGLCRLVGEPDGGRILDLGCGYGRHVIPLAERGYQIVGYDLSSTLLRHGKQRLPSGVWVRGDLRALPFQEQFDTVTSLFTALGYFEEETDNFAVFREIADSLRPGGRFIAQLVNRDYLIRQFQPCEIQREDGLIVLEERSFGSVSSRVITRTTVIEGKETRAYTSSIRVYTVTELDMLLAAAGLLIREVFGGLDFRPYDWDTNQVVIVAEKVQS